MQPGDRVQLIKDRASATVTEALGRGMIRIAMDDGFDFDVHHTEVSLLQPAKNDSSKTRTADSLKPASQNIAHKLSLDAGLYIIFSPDQKDKLQLNIVNTSTTEYLLTGYEKSGDQFSSIVSLHAQPGTTKAVGIYNFDQFEKWPAFYFQWLTFKKSAKQLQAPQERQFKFKAAAFMRALKEVDGYSSKVHVFRIDINDQPIDVKELAERMTEGRQAPEIEKAALPASSNLIDLHLEKLSKGIDVISPTEALILQLNVFEQALDRAIVENRDDITFIHGVGNGSLRHAIHKALSGHTAVDHFKDAEKQKFGYGATFVKLK